MSLKPITPDVLDGVNLQLQTRIGMGRVFPHVTVSRKNAVRVENGEPLGYHLVLAVGEPGYEFLWRNIPQDEQDDLVADARFAARMLRKALQLDGWGIIIEANDENAAQRETFHVHIMLQPPKAELDKLGVERMRAVDPHLIPKRADATK